MPDGDREGHDNRAVRRNRGPFTCSNTDAERTPGNRRSGGRVPRICAANRTVAHEHADSRHAPRTSATLLSSHAGVPDRRRATNNRKSGPCPARSLNESQLAAGGDPLLSAGRHRRGESQLRGARPRFVRGRRARSPHAAARAASASKRLSAAAWPQIQAATSARSRPSSVSSGASRSNSAGERTAPAPRLAVLPEYAARR